MKIYSGLNSLPRAKAAPGLINGCIALEGGAFRGVYTSGVLDCLMSHGINLTHTIGVSAGALNGVNYTAGQIGRSALCNLKYRHDPRWVGRTAIKNNKGVIGFDFLQKDFLKEYPLDEAEFFNPAKHFIAVAADIETGRPEYFDNHGRSMDQVYRTVAASASMPFLSKPVEIDGRRYLDGGCATKLPIRWALEQGFRKVIFVGTNKSDKRRNENSGLGKMGRIVYHKYPALVDALYSANRKYNEDCEMMEDAISDGKMLRLSPSEPVTVGRLEGDMEKLGALYKLGISDTEARIEEVLNYLG